MRGRRTHEELEYAAEQLKRLSELAQGVAKIRHERDRLLAKLFRERAASTGELCAASGLSPNRVRAIAAQEPDEPEPEEPDEMRVHGLSPHLRKVLEGLDR